VYRIITKEILAPNITRFVVVAPDIAAKAEPGHFIIVRAREKSERIPLTIADYSREERTLTIIIQEVGCSSKEISQFSVGESFSDVVGPLGNPISVDNYEKVFCVAGGLGAAPLYPKAKALAEKGAELTTIIGARNKDLIILEDEFKEICQELYLATDDGSRGRKGFVTDILEELLEKEKPDLVIAIGPMIMMKAACDLTARYGVKTIVSLNSLMVDGTGMCGGCRVTVGGETRFACVDGPAFDGHQVDFEEQIRRQKFYAKQEKEALGGECQCLLHH